MHRWLFILFVALFGSIPVDAAPASDVNPEDASELIKTLEDPAARAKLIEQLKLFEKIEAPGKEHSFKDAAGDLLGQFSSRIVLLGNAASMLATEIKHLPLLIPWVKRQFTDLSLRAMWTQILINLFLAIGTGYLALLILQRVFNPLKRRTSATLSLLEKIAVAVGFFILDLIPIVAFAVVARIMLQVLGPNEETALVVLAWVDAAVVVRIVVDLARAILMPDHPNLRIGKLSDESAHYGIIWLLRLSTVSVYGYFLLDLGLTLGANKDTYIGLFNMLGLLVAGMLIVLIAQNRTTLTASIRRPLETEADSTGEHRAWMYRFFARFWHLLAGAYVIALYVGWSLSAGNGFQWFIRVNLLSVFVFIIGLVFLRASNILFERGFRISVALKETYPGLDARANRYIPVLHSMTRGLIILLGLFSIMQIWGINVITWLTGDSGRVIGGTLISIGSILIVALLMWELGNGLIERHLARADLFGQMRIRSGRLRTLLAVGRNALRVTIIVVAGLMVLAQLDINITPLLAGAGVMGVALGFGSQKLVQDVITGVFILFEDIISVGDIVDIGDKSGVVEAISIRNVTLRDMRGAVHTIPFNSISTISNLTKDFSYYVFDIGVGYGENVDEVIEVLRTLGDELQSDQNFSPLILEPLEILGLDRFDDSAVVIKARLKTIPTKQWLVGREFNRRMKKRFDEKGIEIPYPHVTHIFTPEREGKTPIMPMNAHQAATQASAQESESGSS